MISQAEFDDEMVHYKEVFSQFDNDGDGAINATELNLVMRILDIYRTKADIRRMIQEVDEDDSGTIQFPEFVNMMMGLKKEVYSADELLAAFEVFDSDGDGYISASELHHIMTCTLQNGEAPDERMIAQIIRDADTNGDGRIEYPEFVKLVTSRGG